MSENDLAIDAIAACRRHVREGLGIECTFVDDIAALLVALAQRAVLAGLATDADADTLQRMSEACEPHREAHEQSLGFKLRRDRP